MKRKPKAAIIMAAAIVCFAISLMATWLIRAPSRGEAVFRNDFKGIREVYVVKQMRWRALELGGRAGMKKLKELEFAPDLSPAGHNMASPLSAYIDSNQHVTDLKEWSNEIEVQNKG